MTPCEKSKSGSEQGAAAQRAAVALEMPPQCRCAAAGLLAVVRDDIDHSLPSTICRMVTRISPPSSPAWGCGARPQPRSSRMPAADTRAAGGTASWLTMPASVPGLPAWAWFQSGGTGCRSDQCTESGEISSLRHRARPSTRRGALRRSSRSPPQVARSSPAAVVATRSAGPSRAAPYGSPKCSRESPRSSSRPGEEPRFRLQQASAWRDQAIRDRRGTGRQIHRGSERTGRIFAVAVTRLGRSSAAFSSRTRQYVTFDELLVAGKDAGGSI